jgi:hypothetical protein
MKKFARSYPDLCLRCPVVAADSFYIVFDKTTKTCSMARSAPTDTEKFSMMGIYGSEADAHMAMAGMTKCKR